MTIHTAALPNVKSSISMLLFPLKDPAALCLTTSPQGSLLPAPPSFQVPCHGGRRQAVLSASDRVMTGISGRRDLCICVGKLLMCASSSPHKDADHYFRLAAERQNKTVCKCEGKPISSAKATWCIIKKLGEKQSSSFASFDPNLSIFKPILIQF